MSAFRRWLWLSPILLLLATPIVHAQDSSASAHDGKSNRIREGTRIHERVGSFRMQDQRIVFVPADKLPESLRVLENLALERVVNALIDPRGSQRWIVSGTVTEYRGLNYLLITRALLQAPDPKPDR